MGRLRGKGGLLTLCTVVVTVMLAVVVLASAGQTSPRVITAGHRQPDLSVKWRIGPTLRELRANFAVLRRPATARERAAVAMFTARTNDQPEVAEDVRVLGRIDGTRVYLVVYPIFRHGARGAVVAHQMTIAGGSGGVVGAFNYTRGSYLIFPQTAGYPNHPITYFGVVPNGVRSVRWQFSCISGTHARQTGCQLPSPHVVTVPVHGNLAVLATNQPWATSLRRSYAGVTRVTWFGAAGMSKVFTNANTAVPIPGAPVWTG